MAGNRQTSAQGLTCRVRAAALSAVVAAGIGLAVGCQASGQPLSQTQADGLKVALDRVSHLADQGNCASAEQTSLSELKARVQGLPATVDAGVRSTLSDGVARLGQLVSDQCSQVSVPDVTGRELDTAENELRARGIRFREAGGGLFGVVVRSHWRACEIEPAPGTRIDKENEVTVVVGRDC